MEAAVDRMPPLRELDTDWDLSDLDDDSRARQELPGLAALRA